MTSALSRAHVRAITRNCSHATDQAISAALGRVLGSIRSADGGATILADNHDEGLAQGVRTPGPKMLLRFTCTHEPSEAAANARVTTKLISKRSYESGACARGVGAVAPASKRVTRDAMQAYKREAATTVSGGWGSSGGG